MSHSKEPGVFCFTQDQPVSQTIQLLQKREQKNNNKRQVSMQIDEQCNPLLSPQSFCSCGKVAQTNEERPDIADVGACKAHYCCAWFTGSSESRPCRRWTRAACSRTLGFLSVSSAASLVMRSSSCRRPRNATHLSFTSQVRKRRHRNKKRWTPARGRSTSVPLCAGIQALICVKELQDCVFLNLSSQQ